MYCIESQGLFSMVLLRIGEASDIYRDLLQRND